MKKHYLLHLHHFSHYLYIVGPMPSYNILFWVINLLILKVPRKRSREEVDKGTMAKVFFICILSFCICMKTILIVSISYKCVFVCISCPKALSSCTNRLSHKASRFNNFCLNQTDRIPRMPTGVKNQLLESSPSATFIMDLPQVFTWKLFMFFTLYSCSSLLWQFI